METTIEKTAETLNDLIIINNDRYEGYQKAMEQTNDADLKNLFSTFSNQSKANNAALRSLVPASEDTPDRDETTHKTHKRPAHLNALRPGRRSALERQFKQSS